MALSARLNLRQSQSMVMTPQLLQSIKLLQFTHAELEQFVEEQIERNPLIERISENDQAPTSDDPPYRDTASPVATDVEISTGTISDSLDANLENEFQDDTRAGNSDGLNSSSEFSGGSGGSNTSLPYMAGDGEFSLEEMVETATTLRDAVLDQIAFVYPGGPERLIALELADALDERGYLDADLPSIATRLGTEQDRVIAVLETLQGFDPPGVFARDLAECLSLQCKRKNRYDPAMAALLANLPLLARRDFKSLCALCGVDEGDLLDMLAEIRHLDPRPGLAYESSPSQTIVHDVDVRVGPDGAWLIELNNDALPRVIVNRQYAAKIQRGNLKADEKSFVSQCLQDATWLERSLDQRATTILKVATEIVRQQDDFFVRGISGLKPMTMKMVADAISMHESTISRVASNKYMLTPRGLFEFRYFFTVAIAGTGANGEDHSSESVRQRIRELIDAETPDNILSDDKLVDDLNAEGIDIARRTVAKYREAMNIPSSVQRRREKRARLRAGT